VRRRPLRLAVPAVIAAALFTACTSSGGGTSTPTAGAGSGDGSPGATDQHYVAHGITFAYPSGWKQLRLTGTSASAGSQDWSATVGLDQRNVVIVSQFTLTVSITPDNIDAKADAIRGQLDSLFTQAGGALTEGPTRERMGGLPALGFAGNAKTPNGDAVDSRLVLAFDGPTEYFVNCQYDTTHTDDVRAACDEIVSSFSKAA
jgi:hypothetical protein